MSARRLSFFRLGLWGVVAIAGLGVLGAVGLLLVGSSVNRSGRIPEAMRAEPASIVKLRRKMAPPQSSPQHPIIPSSTPADSSTSHSAVASAAPLGQGLNDDRWMIDYQHEFRNLGASVTAEQDAWLGAHSNLLNQLHRLVSTAPPKQVAAFFNSLHIPGSGDRYLWAWNGLLLQESQLRMQRGDYAGARAGFLDALRLLDLEIRFGVPRATTMDHVSVACLQLNNGIQNPKWPNEQWTGIPESLEALDARLFDAPSLRNELIDTYLAQRPKRIADLDGPWNSHFYLRDKLNGHDFYMQTGFYWPSTATEIELPRPLKFMGAAARAMAMKRQSAEILKIFDKIWQSEIELSGMAYPERVAARKKLDKRVVKAIDMDMSDWSLALRTFEQNETIVHLARIGLLWRQDPQRARTMRNESLSGRPYHPWRDPFSEKTFQLDETSHGTLIFSLGATSVSDKLKPEDGRYLPGFHINLPAANKKSE